MVWSCMREKKSQITALAAALTEAGFSPAADFAQGTIILERLPEFRDAPAYTLTVVMDNPGAEEWESLFDGCILESGRMVRGAARRSAIYSRKKAVERAKQEKWIAIWTLYDAGILPRYPKPDCERWQDVSLP